MNFNEFHKQLAAAPLSFRRKLREYLCNPTERNAYYIAGYIAALEDTHLFKTEDAAKYWLAVIGRTERMPDVSEKLIAEMDSPPEASTTLEQAESHAHICFKLAEQYKSDPVLFAAPIKTFARYEPETVYIGAGEYIAECVRAGDGAQNGVVAWARPVYARPVHAPESADGWEAGEVVDIEFHNRAEKPEGEGWRPLVVAKMECTRDTWNDGFDFAMKACGWQEGEDPATEGLYVVRDSKGNVEVGMWYAKTATQSAEWTREFRDVDRDDIVAWMAIPDWRTARDAYKRADAMLRAREASND